jgi:hypothetical protein
VFYVGKGLSTICPYNMLPPSTPFTPQFIFYTRYYIATVHTHGWGTDSSIKRWQYYRIGRGTEILKFSQIRKDNFKAPSNA